MKKQTLLFLIISICINAFGQEKIITVDNQELNVRILNKTRTSIEYLLTDCENSPKLHIPLKQINKILYENGEVEMGGNQNPRNLRPFGLSLGVAYFLTVESGIMFLNYDYFIIPQISLEGSIGITDFESVYYSVGGKYHLNSIASDNKLTPFIGVLVGSEFGNPMVQIPIGVNFIASKGLNIGLSFSQLLYFASFQESLIELRVGWRFKR